MKIIVISSLFCLAFLANTAEAVSEYIPIQEKAQGQALTGSQLLNDSLYSNPAASSFAEVYSVETTYTLPRSFEASVLDTRTSGVGGALGYFRSKPFENVDPLQGLRLALSGRVSDSIGIGVTGKSIWGGGVTGSETSYKDADLGVLGKFDFINVGFTLRNLFGGSQVFAQNREWSLGAQLNYDKTMFLSVASYSKWGQFKPFQYSVGVEYVSGYHFALKGGMRIVPDENNTYWSAGASVISPRLSLHYAAEFAAQQGQEMQHTLSLLMMM